MNIVYNEDVSFHIYEIITIQGGEGSCPRRSRLVPSYYLLDFRAREHWVLVRHVGVVSHDNPRVLIHWYPIFSRP